MTAGAGPEMGWFGRAVAMMAALLPVAACDPSVEDDPRRPGA